MSLTSISEFRENKNSRLTVFSTPGGMQDKALNILRAVPIFLMSGKVKFEVTVSPGNGNFEVCVSGGIVASGRVYEPESGHVNQPDSHEEIVIDVKEEEHLRLTSRDVYKELRLRGYDYGSTFQGIISAHNRGED